MTMHRHHKIHDDRHQREEENHNGNGHKANGNLKPLLRIEVKNVCPQIAKNGK